MKKLTILLCLCVLVHGEFVSDTLEVDGLERIYHVYLPPGIEPGLPMVFDLPGYNGSVTFQYEATRLCDVADTANFIVVYPQAIDQKWNSGLGDHPSWPTPDVDDVAFLSEVIDTLFADYAIDTNRVYSMGISNGGMMSFRLAGDLNHRIKKVASVVGAITPTIADALSDKPEIPVLFMLGTSDPILPYEGDQPLYSGSEIVDFWLNHNQCSTPVDSLPLPDFDPADGSTISFFPYNGESSQQQTMYFRLENGGHYYPGSDYLLNWPHLGTPNFDINSTRLIWEFFNSDSFSIHGVWGWDLSLNTHYVAPSAESLQAEVSILNTQSHDYLAHAVLFENNSVPFDTAMLLDDGELPDALASDGIASGYIPVPDVEGFFKLQMVTEDLETGELLGPHDMARFTTAGPIEVVGISMANDDWPNPGDTYMFYLELTNLSESIMIPGVKAMLGSVYPEFLSDSSIVSFGDLDPGETAQSSSGDFFRIDISEFELLDHTEFTFPVEIYSEGTHYWTDSLTITIFPVGVADEMLLPELFALHQNFPNPFNPTTTISYDLSAPSDANLTVYDITGRTVTTLAHVYKPAGTYSVQWSGTDDTGNPVSTGVYFCRFEAGSFSQTIKMLYLK